MALGGSIDRFIQRLSGREQARDFSSLPVWMHPIEQSQVQAVLETLAPKRVLEWGAGGSTRWLLEAFAFIERYVSIEHNRQWHGLVRDKVGDPRLELHLFEPSEPEPQVLETGSASERRDRRQAIQAWRQRAEQDITLMRDYVEFPRSLASEFDFVLVDGRARSLCIRTGFELLRAGGILLLHDAQRPEYHAAMREVGRPVFLEPWEQGQVCFVRKPD
ncbi:hypothetical protein ACNOYE_01660 [Nannocystaceae bacterium ST9]